MHHSVSSKFSVVTSRKATDSWDPVRKPDLDDPKLTIPHSELNSKSQYLNARSSPVRKRPWNPTAIKHAKTSCPCCTARHTMARASKTVSGGARVGASTFLHCLKRRQASLSCPRIWGQKWCSPDKVSAIWLTDSPRSHCNSSHSHTMSSRWLRSSCFSKNGRIEDTALLYLSLVFWVIEKSRSLYPALLCRRSWAVLPASNTLRVARAMCTPTNVTHEMQRQWGSQLNWHVHASKLNRLPTVQRQFDGKLAAVSDYWSYL